MKRLLKIMALVAVILLWEPGMILRPNIDQTPALAMIALSILLALLVIWRWTPKNRHKP